MQGSKKSLPQDLNPPQLAPNPQSKLRTVSELLNQTKLYEKSLNYIFLNEFNKSEKLVPKIITFGEIANGKSTLSNLIIKASITSKDITAPKDGWFATKSSLPKSKFQETQLVKSDLLSVLNTTGFNDPQPLVTANDVSITNPNSSEDKIMMRVFNKIRSHVEKGFNGLLFVIKVKDNNSISDHAIDILSKVLVSFDLTNAAVANGKDQIILPFLKIFFTNQEKSNSEKCIKLARDKFAAKICEMLNLSAEICGKIMDSLIKDKNCYFLKLTDSEIFSDLTSDSAPKIAEIERFVADAQNSGPILLQNVSYFKPVIRDMQSIKSTVALYQDNINLTASLYKTGLTKYTDFTKATKLSPEQTKPFLDRQNILKKKIIEVQTIFKEISQKPKLIQLTKTEPGFLSDLDQEIHSMQQETFELFSQELRSLKAGQPFTD